MYGYGKDEDGNLVIIESEAENVRWIYESYLNSMGVYVIAKALNQKDISTILGAEKWHTWWMYCTSTRVTTPKDISFPAESSAGGVQMNFPVAENIYRETL